MWVAREVCDLNEFIAANGSNYLPQVQKKTGQLALHSVCDSYFGTINLPKVQIGT